MTASGDGTRRAPRAHGKRVHWHSCAHREWGKERLYFWRLRFQPTYPRTEVEQALRQVLIEAHVGSYMVYEVFGDSDLLIRLWLPATITAPEFSALLERHLKPLDLDKEDNFEVDCILRHWVWGDGEPQPMGEDGAIPPPPSDDEIAAVNGGRPPRALLERLGGDDILTTVHPADGIKFAMIVTTPVNALGIDQRRHAQIRLKRILDEATCIKERSLYHGHGLGAFVILGRVRHRDFDAIRDQLAEPIALELGAEWIGARTYTMIVASWEFLPFQDRLPLASTLDEEEIGIEEALSQPENVRIEVKGSALVNCETFLKNNGQRVKDLRVTHALLRAMTALLNSEGGTIVVGALERKRLNGLEAHVAASPRRGEYVCTGIEFEWSNGRRGGWDGYERALNAHITRRIQPLATTWIRLVPEHVEDATLMRIVVNRPDRHWYYLDELEEDAKAFKQDSSQFWVRHGGSTSELSGPASDEYKSINPRR